MLPSSKSNKKRALITIVGVGVICKESELLICKRKHTSLHGGFWEFPGGKMENNECIKDTIRRELIEELGVKATIGQKLGEFEYEYQTEFVRLVVFFVTIDASKIQLHVHDDVAWVSMKDITRYKILPSNVAIINALTHSLQ